MEFKALVFDLDGTLYEPRHFALRLIFSDPLHIGMLAAERKCRKKLRERHFDKASDYYDALFLMMAGGSAEKAGKCREWFYGSYMPSQVRIIREKFGPRPQLKELLTALHAEGIRTAVLSDYCFTTEKLAAIGLSEADFDAVWESPQFGGLKPRREVFTGARKALGTTPEETAMVGDRADTDGGAVQAGLGFFHIVKEDSSAKEKRVAKKSFAHPPTDLLTPADWRLRPLSGVSRAHARSLRDSLDRLHKELTWNQFLQLFLK